MRRSRSSGNACAPQRQLQSAGRSRSSGNARARWGRLQSAAGASGLQARAAVHDGPAVAEAEVNPLIVRANGEGVVAVDALVKLA